MSNMNAKRLYNQLQMTIGSPASSTRQAVSNTGCWRCGDEIEFWDSADGICLGSTSLGTRIIDCIDPNVAFFFTATIDLTAATGTVIAVNKTLDDQQAFNNRLCDEGNPQNSIYSKTNPIASFVENSPIGGQMTLTMTQSTISYQAGDSYKVLSDTGVVVSGTIVSVNNTTQDIVIDQTSDLDLVTGEKLANCCDLSLEDIIDRISTVTGGASDCEDDFDGNCKYAAYELTDEMVANSSHVMIDGRLLRRGSSAGTRSSYTHGAATSQLVFTAMALGSIANNFKIELVNAAGTAVTVTGDWPDLKVSVNTDSNTATAAQIKAAIEADADARRILQVDFGVGDGTGAVSALAETDLAGGTAAAGQHDYVELFDENGDRKWIVLHIDPSAHQRLNSPLADTEWLHVDYEC